MSSDTGYRTESFFVLRTPSLSSNAIAGLRHEYAEGAAVSNSELMRSPFVREAIFLASPNLYGRLSDIEAGSDDRLQLSLARYLYRMATRCTPFGLFAGVTVGAIEHDFSLLVEDSEASKRVSRLDIGAVTRLQSALFRERATPEALSRVALVPNTSLWSAPDGFRYVQTHWDENAISYKLARAEITPALQLVLELTGPAELNFAAVAEHLSRAFEVAVEAARTFLLQLIQAQIVNCVPNVRVTGDDALAGFIAQVSQAEISSPIVTALAEAQRLVAGIDGDSAANIAAYSSVAAILKGADPAIDGSDVVQIDLHKPALNSEVPESLTNGILGQIWSLRSLLGTREIEELVRFKQEFEERFGDARVPFLQALDEDFGVRIGVPSTVTSPLIDTFPHTGRAAAIALGKPDLLLLNLAQAAAQRGSHEIEITDDDLSGITGDGDELPSSFSIVGSLAAKSPDWLRDGDYRFYLSAISGIPSSALFGRFCCGNALLTDRVRTLIQRVEPDTDSYVVAEVVHLPEGRVGNVMLRPVLRNYEVTYLGTSGAREDRQIDVRDLEIFLQNGHIVLFSKRLAKRVIPRITNALSFFTGRTLPAYRLLGLLQYQGEFCPRPVLSNLGEALGAFPAIRYRNIVLRRSTALLTQADTRFLAKSLDSPEMTGEGARDFLAKRGIGHHVRVQLGDSFLELDLRERLDLTLFREECRRNKTLRLENLDGYCQDLARDRSGNALRQELVIPASRERPQGEIETALSPAVHGGGHAAFPGGEWLYARVFCGSSIADWLVADVFPEFAAFARSANCTRPFFIRYDQNGTHLRLRVQGPAETVWGPVRQELERMLSAPRSSGAIARVEYATYFPETSRYGGRAGLESCEHIFSRDSDAAAAAMAAILQSADPEEERWKFALASMVRLLRDFGLGPQEEGAIVDAAAYRFAREFGLGKVERTAINAKYREHRKAVDSIVGLGSHPAAPYEAVLAVRTSAIEPHVGRLTGELGGPLLGGILQSLLHMTANRIFSDRARLNEMMLLHFMAKSASSLRGRAAFAARP